LRKGFYLLRDLGIILAAVIVMIFVGLGISRIANNRLSREPRSTRPAVLRLELALKAVISESIKTTEYLTESHQLDRALDSVTGRLLEGLAPLPYEIEILVLHSPVVNAVNFPGGLIVVYSGLIMELESPEEMAAVLAHELGHVVNRDSIKSIMRQTGIAAFFSAFGGRGGQVVAQRILREAANIKYSRSVEQRADNFTFDLLISAGIDPAHMGKALENLKQKKNPDYMKILRYIDTHPSIDSRVKSAYERSASVDIEEKKFDIQWEKVKDSLPEPERKLINLEDLLR
jgi:predicted Zn-dependent protease